MDLAGSWFLVAYRTRVGGKVDGIDDDSNEEWTISIVEYLQMISINYRTQMK
jgi:hypothetical protein